MDYPTKTEGVTTNRVVAAGPAYELRVPEFPEEAHLAAQLRVIQRAAANAVSLYNFAVAESQKGNPKALELVLLCNQDTGVMTDDERARRRAQLSEDGYNNDEAAQIMNEERGMNYHQTYKRPVRVF